MIRRSASLYLRQEKIFILPEVKTTNGLWLISGPGHVLDDVQDLDAVAHAARDALSSSGHIVPMPSRDDTATEVLLRLTGLSSYRTFMKGAKSVSLSEVDEFTKLTPMRRVGSSGFDYIASQAITITSPEELPRAIADALLAAV